MRHRGRTRIAVSAGCLSLGTVGALLVSAAPLADPQIVPLYSQAVGLSVTSGPQLLATRDLARLLPGTRILRPEGASEAQRRETRRLADRSRDWLAEGSVPGAGGPFEDMATTALLDLHVLTSSTGATVAGWSPAWRYVWPRDASFAAAALARTGHLDDALANLSFLQSVQVSDGSFHARYLPDGSGPPDARGLQEDGPGWALWAVAEVAAEIEDDAARRELLLRYRHLVDRSAARISALTDAGARLPAPSSDYWEVRESAVTLGVAATMLAGLEAAARLHTMSGHPGRATSSARSAQRLRARIEATFGAERYPRHLGLDDPDAALTFVLPPFQPRGLDGAARALDEAVPRMLRPAGGIAPGSSWKRDGISWTPETALLALAAAHAGDTATAESWLGWLDAHRTRSGSLPEKVLSGGLPAAVAPLSWTAATVLLTLDQLDTAGGRPRARATTTSASS